MLIAGRYFSPIHKNHSMLKVNSRVLSATRIQYGELRGAPLYMITLENAAVTVELINLGATITAIYAPERTL
jgi:aldose 1-epimerase